MITTKPETNADRVAKMTRAAAGKPGMVDIDRLHPTEGNRPRGSGTEGLRELSNSIKLVGVLSPLMVEPMPSRPGHFHIRAGHRRWAASRLAGLAAVPVFIVRSAEPGQMLSARQIAIIENTHRNAMDPVELAIGLSLMLDESGGDVRQVAHLTAMSEATVRYHLELAALDPATQAKVISGELTVGSAHEAVRLARRAGGGTLPTRDTESRSNGFNRQTGTRPRSAPHMTAQHPLASAARAMCNLEGHPKAGRLHQVACEECWEYVIRQDAAGSAGRPLIPGGIHHG